MKESKIIVELHKIRERHFDETKGMSPSEFLKNLKVEVATIKNSLQERKKSNTESHQA